LAAENPHFLPAEHMRQYYFITKDVPCQEEILIFSNFCEKTSMHDREAGIALGTACRKSLFLGLAPQGCPHSRS